jgi:hypothetical protein
MDKNKIKLALTNRFLSEEKTPGISVTASANKKSGTINKAGVKAIDKDMKAYDKSLTQTDSEAKTMAQNKFNYTDDNEKTYHDEMEILNGQEMIEYNSDPGSDFIKKAKMNIEGDSLVGNAGGKGVGNAEETWGASSDNFGKDLVKRVNASAKKRADAEIQTYGMGDVQIPTGRRVQTAIMATNGNDAYTKDKTTIGKSKDKINTKVVKENKTIKEGLSEKGITLVQKWVNELGSREAGVKMIDNILGKSIGISSSDLPDSVTFSNGLDEIEGYIEDGDFSGAFDMAKETVRDMLEDEGYPMFEGDEQESKKIDNGYGSEEEYEFNKKQKTEDPTLTSVDKNEEKGKKLKKESELLNNNKTIKKEGMKRLKFNKEFNGVGNALKLIPETYKINNKTFEMTDGNENYRIRWEGTLSEGRAIILTASNKDMVNEEMNKMKHLFTYDSSKTLGNTRNTSRLTEDTVFADILGKTKKMLGESEEIEDETASTGDLDDAVKSAPEAKKHIEGSVSTEKGTKAPAPKKGEWENVTKKASEATKHVEGSVSDSKGTVAPKPKTGEWEDAKIASKPNPTEPSSTTYAPAPKVGEWDKLNVPYAVDAKKHITMSEGVKKKLN